MRHNRYHPSRKFAPQYEDFLGITPAWWGLSAFSALSFTCVIYWLLTNPLAAI